MPEYSFRSLYAISEGEENERLFAERIVSFKGQDFDDCNSQALAEVRKFLEMNPHYRRIGDVTVLEITREDDTKTSGTETWAMLYRAESEDSFLRAQLEIYNPDTD